MVTFSTLFSAFGGDYDEESRWNLDFEARTKDDTDQFFLEIKKRIGRQHLCNVFGSPQHSYYMVVLSPIYLVIEMDDEVISFNFHKFSAEFIKEVETPTVGCSEGEDAFDDNGTIRHYSNYNYQNCLSSRDKFDHASMSRIIRILVDGFDYQKTRDGINTFLGRANKR